MQKNDFHNRYDIVTRLGKGQFSTVYEVLEKATNKHWACKVVNKSSCPASALETELAILAQLDHPQTVRLKEVFNTDEVCIIVQELVTGGELFDKISEQGVFSEQYAAKFFHEMLLVIKYLHGLNIVHTDLKPKSFMLSDRSENAVLKIIGLGASKHAAHDKAINGMRGTPPYMAPEIFAYQSYGKPVDMWALGVILYVILAGKFPYDTDERKFVRPFYSPEFDNISESAKELLLKLMEINPEKRCTVEQALAHPWVTGAAVSAAEIQASNLRQLVARKEFKDATASAAETQASNLRQMVARKKLNSVVETISTANHFQSIPKLKQSPPVPAHPSKQAQPKNTEKVKENLRKTTEDLDAAEKLLQDAIDNITEILSMVDEDVAAVRKKLKDIKHSVHVQSSHLKTLLYSIT